MAQYYLNPLASPGPNGIQQGLSALADVLTNAPARRLDSQIAAATTRAQMENQYAGAYANKALGDARYGELALDQNKLDAFNQIQTVLSGYEEGTPWNVIAREVMPLMLRAGIDPEAFMRSAILYGAPMADVDAIRQSFGDSFKDTQTGWNAEPVPVIDTTTGRPTYAPQGFLSRAGAEGSRFAPILSETDAKGTTFQYGMDADQRRSTVMGLNEPYNVVDPNSGLATTISQYDAIKRGAQPVLPETQVKGLNMQTGATPAAGIGFEGTGMEAQQFRILGEIWQKVQNGQPVAPNEQILYSDAYRNLTKPKTSLREGADGKIYRVQEPGAVTQYPAPEALFSSVPARAPTSASGQDRVVAPMDPGPLPSAPLAFGLQAPGALPAPPPAPTPALPQEPPQDPWAITVQRAEGFPEPGPKPPTEAQARFRQYSARITNGAGNLMDVLGYDIGTGTFKPGAWAPEWWEAALIEKTPYYLLPQVLDEQAMNYVTAVAQVLNPLIRADSGAAVPDSEYPRYYMQYIPLAGEPQSTARMKLDHLAVTLAAFEAVSQDPQFAEFMAKADAAMAAGDEGRANISYKGAERILWAAKFRIADELGVKIMQTPDAPAPAPGAAAPEAAAPTGQPTYTIPDTLRLPGGVVLERVK